MLNQRFIPCPLVGSLLFCVVIAVLAPVTLSKPNDDYAQAIAVIGLENQPTRSDNQIIIFSASLPEKKVSVKLASGFPAQMLRVLICKDGSTLWDCKTEDSPPYLVVVDNAGSGGHADSSWMIDGSDSIVGLIVRVEGADRKLLGTGVVGIANDKANSARTATAVICELRPIYKSNDLNVSGVFEIYGGASMQPGEVSVIGKVQNLVGGLAYGVHIHTYGNLNSESGLSTGSHYNPDGGEHRLPGGEGSIHKGDLGNIAFYSNDGSAWYHEKKLKSPSISIPQIVGRALVVHSQMDNGCEQPTGGSGFRLAFCVFSISPKHEHFLKATEIPFSIPSQQGSKGCSLSNSPEKPTKSTSFIWMTVIICIALAGIGILFAYNWWRSRNNPAGNNATGRNMWFPQPESDDEENTSS